MFVSKPIFAAAWLGLLGILVASPVAGTAEAATKQVRPSTFKTRPFVPTVKRPLPPSPCRKAFCR